MKVSPLGTALWVADLSSLVISNDPTIDVRQSIVALIVTYQPEPARLAALLARLRPQVASIVIADNGGGAALVAPRLAEVIDLGGNHGIAAAQNAGLARARALGAHYVLLLDQDSLPAEDMVPQLLAALHALRRQGARLAAVGPCIEDPRRPAPLPFRRQQGLHAQFFTCRHFDEPIKVDVLPASGMLIPLPVLDDIAGPDDSLFIDYADTEWCLRAQAKGYALYGVCAARMSHHLGEEPRRAFGRWIPGRSGVRLYYHFRNALLLYRRAYLPLGWRLRDVWRLCLQFGYYAVFSRPWGRNVRFILLGLWHGLRGVSGKLDGFPH